MLFDCVSFLYGEEQPVRVILAGAIFEVSSDHYRPAPEETLSRRLIKGYYEAEDAMLKAVSEGDADKALRCKSSLRNTQKQD